MSSKRSVCTTSATQRSTSTDGKVQLQIISQPETQHRARYQTEGSRGSIKDRRGNGFPTVKLIGYEKPTKLQVLLIKNFKNLFLYQSESLIFIRYTLVVMQDVMCLICSIKHVKYQVKTLHLVLKLK